MKPSPFQTNAEAVTLLVHIFADIERLTNTRATHRTPLLSSNTPSRNLENFVTSLTSLACAFGLCICTRQWCAHWQRLTSIVTSLLGRMPWVFTRRHTARARVWELNGSAAYARTTNPLAKGCSEGRRDLPEMSRSSSCQLD